MKKPYLVLDFLYRFDGVEQHLFPVVLFGKNDVVLVDCGYPGSLGILDAEMRRFGLMPESITKLLLTHQDDDHVGAAAELKEAYPNIQIIASERETPFISGERKNLRLQQAEEIQASLPEDQKEFGLQFCERLKKVRPVWVDNEISHGDAFDWGGGCEIVETPGHTPGHISIRASNNDFLITGDAAVIENNALAIANPEFCLDLKTAQKSLDKLLEFQCPCYICYHGGVWRG